ncbi:MAG TPA: DsbA family protein [Solirubrobacteraceae bacterium]|nr:DsbA family protein [Solirubrobacteraceae bacterium]
MPARFYYDLNSPYAYLAAHRVDDVIPAAVEWMPIAFGPLLVATRRVPWSLTPGEREEGMRECERRAAERGLPPIVWPDGWPAESYSVDGARAALVAARQGRQREMALALFEQVFAHGGRLDDPAAIAAAARRADVEDVEAGIADPAVKQELRDRTEAAMAAGVAGVPTVEVGGRLFWGDDRLEEAAAP